MEIAEEYGGPGLDALAYAVACTGKLRILRLKGYFHEINLTILNN